MNTARHAGLAFRLFAPALLCCVSLGAAGAPISPRVGPPRAASAQTRLIARRPSRVLSESDAASFMHTLARSERNFFAAGVAYDAATGMTFDSHPIDTRTGQLRGGPRNWSAASKESLHIIMLLKAIEGDSLAQAVLSPDEHTPSRAVDAAIAVLGKKIATYKAFDREHPGFGGFLPWYKIENGKMAPDAAWTDRVPSLDNGQLAWSLYRAVDVLERHGHGALADQYRGQLDLMKRNVVDMFYDPATRQLRTEAKLARGSALAPAQNHYTDNQPGHHLDDPYEGLLMCHFADLFGDWQHHAAGKELLWAKPRRTPDTYKSKRGDRRITVVQGNSFSSHEDWGFLVLPFRDVPIADRLFSNAQKARTSYSAEHGFDLLAATSTPSALGSDETGYLNQLGVPGISKDRVSPKRVFAPYAAFPIALSDKPMFATWLKHMVETPHMRSRYGMGESYTKGGKKVAPLLTWDGKALPLIAWMGGIGPEIATQLKHDGVYDSFIARVKADYRKFAAHPIEGARFRIAAPSN